MLCRLPLTGGHISCYYSIIVSLERTCEVKISLSGGKHDPKNSDKHHKAPMHTAAVR